MKKFLIIQTAFIGDVVLATPLIEKLKRFYPDAQIDFLLRKGNESLLQGHPHVHKVLIFDKREKKQRNLIRMIRQVRREKYDHVINLQRFITTGMLTVLSGAKQTIGFDKNPLSGFFSRRKPHTIETSGNLTHEVVRNLSLIQSLTDDSFMMPRLYPAASDYAKVVAKGPYICMAPASVWYTKQWPVTKWVELVNAIPSGYTIYLLGAKGDLPMCETIQKAAGGRNPIIILAGQLSFLESAALMQLAQMNYVNDSAPLHFASAMNAPVSAIFCSTVPAFGFGPLSDQAYVFETDEQLDCRPCGLHGYKACPKRHFKCANIQITPLVDVLGA